MLEYSTALRHAQNEALIAYAGTGAKINLYQGTQPASANDPITTQTLLVTLTINGVFGTDVDGTLTLGNVTPAEAIAEGNMQFFRITQAGGAVVMDGSVGISGKDMNFNQTSVVPLQTVQISSGTIIRNNI